MKKYRPFDSDSMRVELLGKLNSIPNVHIPNDGINRRPSIPSSIFAGPKSMNQLIDTLDWLVDKIIDANK
jgi:hypothetical protein